MQGGLTCLQCQPEATCHPKPVVTEGFNVQILDAATEGPALCKYKLSLNKY